MVGYGSSLRRARRSGWYDAYLDYERLKSILNQIETLYDDISPNSLDTHRFADDLTKATSTDAGEMELHVENGFKGAPQSRERSLTDPGPSAAQEADLRLADAHRQARDLAERFLALLKSEVEKVCLFALARQGELANAVGALRFSSAPLRISVSSGGLSGDFNGEEDDDDWSSDDEEHEGSWKVGNLALGEAAALLPRSSSRTSLVPRDGNALRGSTASSVQTHPMFRGDGVLTASVVATAPPSLSASGVSEKMDAYSSLGVELLHLIRYICVNAMGVRKIIKKHDKLLTQKMLGAHQAEVHSPSHKRGRSAGRSEVPGALDVDSIERQPSGYKHSSHRLLGGADKHLQQLANSSSIAAIAESIQSALLESPVSFSDLDGPSLVRLECVVSSVHALRECADVVNTPFGAFLSRKAMIFTGHDLGGLEGTTREALDFLLQFKPELILRMDAAALAEWRERAADHVYAYPGFGAAIRPRLASYVSEREASREKKAVFHELGGISRAAMLVNLMSTLLYTVNYYIVAPTANHYAILLGTDGAFGATLVGASSFTALFSAFLLSWWYTRYSFRSALFFSSLCPCVGNLLYSYAISRHSMAIAMSGRLLVGFGSAEVVNRQIISTCVSFQSMTQASALFVAAGALGMSVGPFLAAILDSVAGRDVEVDLQVPLLGGIMFNHVTSPGFVMAVMWFMETMAIIFCFHEPERINVSSFQKETEKSRPSGVTTTYGTRNDASHEEKIPLTNGANEGISFLSVAFSEIATIKNLILQNPALPITLLLFAYIECLDEVLISSCSMVCRRYFKWHGSTAGFIIASLGALVLPAHFVVEHASRHYDERAIMKYSVLFITVSLLAILNYQGMVIDTLGLSEEVWEDVANDITNSTVAVPTSRRLGHHEALPYDWGAGVFVYLISLAAAFLGTIVLEGVDTSLMSKVTPSKLNDTFINCGLLATLVGTLGRVLGDGTITFSALIDKNIFTDFINDTFIPMIPLALLGYYFVKKHYKKLL